MSKPLLQANNFHYVEAPVFDFNDPDKYFGYFVNEDSEQAVFVYDKATHSATLYMGDVEWVAIPIEEDKPIGIIMGEQERAWLIACWETAKRWDWKAWL